ncbi:MAG: 30S ribosomal protein S6 [Pseudomonadota bacterium]
MRHYETIYIINPDLADEDYREVLKKFLELVENHKGAVVKVEEWGKQRLAYLVKKFDRGSYVLMGYCGWPPLTQELERELKLDDRVIKYQTVKLADNVDPQALIQKEKEMKKEREVSQEKTTESEETVLNGKEIAPNEEVTDGV